MTLRLLPIRSKSHRNLRRIAGRMPHVLRRGIGLLLISTAFTFVVLHALSFSLSLAGLSVMLLLIAFLILIAVASTQQGITGLIGLFFLTTVVFNLGRPILWLFTREDTVYDLAFGFSYSAPEDIKIQLLLFWCIAIAGFFGGYFAFFRERPSTCPPLAPVTLGYCRRAFFMTLAIICTVIPFLLASNLRTFAAAGYAGLYRVQTHYRFSLLRVAEYLLPVLFALAVLLRRRRYARLTAIVAGFYILTGLLVGQRASIGEWILVAIWYMTTISGRRPNRWFLLGGGAVMIVFFQLLAGWRQGQTTSLTALEFFIQQGVTFLLPELSSQFPRPPIHTVAASLFPLGGMDSLLGIGSAETESLGNYLSSHANILRFEAGYGMGSTFSLEIYYAVGAILVLFAAGCVVAGWILQRWEAGAQRGNLARFYLCACLPYIFFLPRGSISLVNAGLIYASAYMAGVWFLITVLVFASRPRSAGMRKHLVMGGPLSSTDHSPESLQS